MTQNRLSLSACLLNKMFPESLRPVQMGQNVLGVQIGRIPPLRLKQHLRERKVRRVQHLQRFRKKSCHFHLLIARNHPGQHHRLDDDQSLQ